ncbi:MAG: DUF1178 family protein [Devosiaceae bacterium]|nr:DUF1178 family protein [Devosiaceae bacterium MH13]
MISFSLVCSKGHRFDGWFRGNDDFDRQCAGSLVACPVCGDTEVSKALMAPRVSTARSKAKAAKEVQSAMMAARAQMRTESKSSGPVEGDVLPPEAPVQAVASLKDAPAPVKAYVEAVRKLRSEIEASSEDVGSRFAEEARKMHHGDVEERPIRGNATLEDAAALDEEGIDLFVIPPLPEDGN